MKIPKTFQQIRLFCLAKVTEFTALAGSTGATAFIAAGRLSMATNAKHFVNVLSWMLLILWFWYGLGTKTPKGVFWKSRYFEDYYCDSSVAKISKQGQHLQMSSTFDESIRCDLRSLLPDASICSRLGSQRFDDRFVLERWLQSRSFCSKAVFRKVFSDRNRHKYSSFCTNKWRESQIERSQLRLKQRKNDSASSKELRSRTSNLPAQRLFSMMTPLAKLMPGTQKRHEPWASKQSSRHHGLSKFDFFRSFFSSARLWWRVAWGKLPAGWTCFKFLTVLKKK